MSSTAAAVLHALLSWFQPRNAPNFLAIPQQSNSTKTLIESAMANETFNIPYPMVGALEFIIRQIPLKKPGSNSGWPFPLDTSLAAKTLLFTASCLLYLFLCARSGRWFGRHLTKSEPSRGFSTIRSLISTLLAPLRYVLSLTVATLAFVTFLTAYVSFCVWDELAHPKLFGANPWILAAVRLFILVPLILLFRAREQVMRGVFDPFRCLLSCCWAGAVDLIVGIGCIFHHCYPRIKLIVANCRNNTFKAGAVMFAWIRILCSSFTFILLILVGIARSVISALSLWIFLNSSFILCVLWLTALVTPYMWKHYFWIILLSFPLMFLTVSPRIFDFVVQVVNIIYIRPHFKAIRERQKDALRKKDERISELEKSVSDSMARETNFQREISTLRATRCDQQVRDQLEAVQCNHEERRQRHLSLLKEHTHCEKVMDDMDVELQQKDDTIQKQKGVIHTQSLELQTVTEKLAKAESHSASQTARIDDLIAELGTRSDYSTEEVAAAEATFGKTVSELAQVNAELGEEKRKHQAEKTWRVNETARANQAESDHKQCLAAKSDLENKLTAVTSELETLKSNKMDVEPTVTIPIGLEEMAKAKYWSLFPHGHMTESAAQSDKYSSSFVAVGCSVLQQYPDINLGFPLNALPVYLGGFFEKNRARINDGLESVADPGRPLHPRQLARVVQYWSESKGLNFRLAVVTSVQGRLEPVLEFDDLQNDTPGRVTICVSKSVAEGTREAYLNAPWHGVAPNPKPEPKDPDSKEMARFAQAKFDEAFPRASIASFKVAGREVYKGGLDALRESLINQLPGTQTTTEDLVRIYDSFVAMGVGELTRRNETGHLTIDQLSTFINHLGSSNGKKLVFGTTMQYELEPERYHRLASNYDGSPEQTIIWMFKRPPDATVEFAKVPWQAVSSRRLR